MISNLAYIHPDAKIGNNVTVEPFAYIAGDVVIGDGCWIGPGAVIHDGARIGKGCRIHTAASVSCLPQDLKFAGEVTTAEIGDYNDIREYVTISRGTASRGKTVVGDHNLLMAYVHIAHDDVVGSNCVIANRVSLAGEVEIGDWVVIGGHAAIHQWTRIGDHAMNIAQHARDMAKSDHRFSPAAQADLQVITDALTETVTRATQAFRDGDIPAAERVEPLEDVIDSLSAQLRDRHVKRLQAGQCEFANSFAFDEILTDLERVGDHCSNIAACEIALSAANMDMHAYRDAVKAGETGDFRSERKAAAAKYRLPPL